MDKMSDSKAIAQEWVHHLVMICTVAGLFLWCHHEMHLNQKETRTIIHSIQDEMKDFHGRLCSIEERNKKYQDYK